MTSRWHSPNTELSVLAALGTELELASARIAQRQRRGPLPFGRRSVALAAAAMLCGGGAALAASGVLEVGSTIPAGGPPGPPENRSSVAQTIQAEGASPVAGPWHITSYGSPGIVDDGEVLEPRGLPCLELSLTDPPPATPILGTSFCGAEIGRQLMFSSLPVNGLRETSELLLFGSAPEDVPAVTVVADGDRHIPAQLFDGTASHPGDLWAVALPAGLRSATVGIPGGDRRDVSDSLNRLERVDAAIP
jgi:hypothetical protein